MASKKARARLRTRRRAEQEASRNFNRLIGSVEGLIERIEAGEMVTPTEITGAVTGLSKALNTVMVERSKADEADARERGAVDGYALDLDAARLEIGSRLDRLRRAGTG